MCLKQTTKKNNFKNGFNESCKFFFFQSLDLDEKKNMNAKKIWRNFFRKHFKVIACASDLPVDRFFSVFFFFSNLDYFFKLIFLEFI